MHDLLKLISTDKEYIGEKIHINFFVHPLDSKIGTDNHKCVLLYRRAKKVKIGMYTTAFL